VFIGHALFAFAVAALVADWRGWDRRPALFVGIVAGAFAAIPDIDVAYALVGLLEWHAADGALGASTAFWDASRVVHRSVTHSLVVGAIAAPAFGLLAVSGRTARVRALRTGAIGTLGALVAVALVWDGPLAALVMGLFAASGILVARWAARASPLSPSTVTLAALWGLWSHPWGTSLPAHPGLALPVWLPALESRVVLHSDPTLHLLGAFAIELAAIAFALVTICRLTDRSLLGFVDRRAGVGAAYGVAALAVTPPTLEVSYHFVFSILGVGLLCGVVRGPLAGVPARDLSPTPVVGRGPRALAYRALAAIAVALAAYAIVYLVVPT